jgi:predicted permease
MKLIARRLLRAPAFTGLAILTLALGIGATTAVFSVVNGILLKPLPFHEPERLVGLWHTAAGLDNLKEIEMSPSLYFVYQDHNRTFESIALYRTDLVAITGSGQPEQEETLTVTHTLLPLLGVKPYLGRNFSAQDDSDGTPLTTVITWGYWQRHFGGRSSVVGSHLTTNGQDCQIIGVLPKDFRFLNEKPALILPFQFNRNKITLGNFSQRGVARLKPGVTLAQANADVARMIPMTWTLFPPPGGYSAKLFMDARFGPGLHPLRQDVVGDIGRTLWVIMGTIAGVLLIACANVANLMLVRAEGRQHELSIRSALGAGSGRIARDLLSESLTLGLLGGVLGLGLAYGALRLLISIAPANLPRLEEITVDPLVIAFTATISLVAGLLFGVLPAARYSGATIRLREGGRGMSHSKDRVQARHVLVVAQVALALVLLIGSGLMIRTFQALHAVDPGFARPKELLTLRVGIPGSAVKDPVAATRLLQQMNDKLAQLPGVEAVSFASGVTMDGNSSGDPLMAQDQPVADGKVPAIRRFKFVAPGFFPTMGNRLVAGRDLTWTDLYDLRPVVLVTENLAREMWGSPAAALGKRVRDSLKSDWHEVIGVTADVYDQGVDKQPPTTVYAGVLRKNFSADGVQTRRNVVFAIRSSRTGSAEFLKQVQQTVWSVVPNIPIASVRTMDELYAKSMARTSFTLVMLAIAGSMALVLGLIGIYGAISYSVTQRTREIGIRMALGARQSQVRGMFIRSGLVLTGGGVLLGLAGAAGLTRLMKSLLFGVAAADPLTWSAMAGAMIVAALAASYVPARRATAVDPVNTLRAE